jgi:hypothetical protein
MVKRKVKNWPIGRLVQAFLILNAGTNGEAADLARAILGWLTGRRTPYTVSVSIDQAIAYLENNYMEAIAESGKVMIVTQIVIFLAGAAGLPRRSRILTTDTAIHYVQWY